MTMWLQIIRPAFPPGVIVKVSRIYPKIGDRLNVGERFIDFLVDVSAGAWLDCPAVSTSRITLREPAWLRGIPVEIGQQVEEGAVIGLLSTVPDEEPEAAFRRARINAATVVDQADWWAE